MRRLWLGIVNIPSHTLSHQHALQTVLHLLFGGFDFFNLLIWEQKLINTNVKRCVKGQIYWGSWLVKVDDNDESVLALTLRTLSLTKTRITGTLMGPKISKWALDKDDNWITQDVDEMQWSSEDSKFKHEDDIWTRPYSTCRWTHYFSVEIRQGWMYAKSLWGVCSRVCGCGFVQTCLYHQFTIPLIMLLKPIHPASPCMSSFCFFLSLISNSP